MEKKVELVDASGVVVNRIIIDDNSTWTPPVGHTIREIADGATFGEPAPVLPIPPRDIQKEVDVFAISNEPNARAIRGLGRTIFVSLSNFIGKYNAVMDILASGRFPTPAEAASLVMPVRDFATLMAVTKTAAKNEIDPNA